MEVWDLLHLLRHAMVVRVSHSTMVSLVSHSHTLILEPKAKLVALWLARLVKVILEVRVCSLRQPSFRSLTRRSTKAPITMVMWQARASNRFPSPRSLAMAMLEKVRTLSHRYRASIRFVAAAISSTTYNVINGATSVVVHSLPLVKVSTSPLASMVGFRLLLLVPVAPLEALHLFPPRTRLHRHHRRLRFRGVYRRLCLPLQVHRHHFLRRRHR